MQEYPTSVLSTPQQVLDELGAKDFRSIRKDQVITLFNMAHRMTPELRESINKQIPALTKMAADTIKDAQKTVQVSIKERSDVTRESLKVSDDAIKTIGKIAECDHLSEAERDKMSERVMKLAEEAKEQGEKTNEDSQSSTNALIYIAGAALLGVGFYVGLKVDPKLIPKLLEKYLNKK